MPHPNWFFSLVYCAFYFYMLSYTLRLDTNYIKVDKFQVSFAAEVDEQQERISKESARRDACCCIQ